MKQAKHTNALIHESSPYLLQHAHNPVNWMPWNPQTLEKAKSENKLLLISIGYSACHWCHVMEHESFEDPDVAQIMNDYFICIKVDREERPDVDHIYMTAVQLITGRGGWPLNCIALPDGRPIWGGTYFRKKEWKEALLAVHRFTLENPQKTEEYAHLLQEGIDQNSLIQEQEKQNIHPEFFTRILNKWQADFDTQDGGTKGAPKFMLPNNWQFLLKAGARFGNKAVVEQVKLTLKKMAFGGLYDQVGGGFARYSTDKTWKVPHFEKMLYDNAQLLELYAEAFQYEPNPLYEQVVSETISFLKREMCSLENGFYSALDADSDGEEGKFYTWTTEELRQIPGNDFALFSSYFNVNSTGFWEYNQYILMRTETDADFAEKHNLTEKELQEKTKKWKEILLDKRAERVRPGLDDKILASWNAMTVSGLTACYKAFGNSDFLELALSNASFLRERMISGSQVWHSYKNKTAKIPGFLEDYAFVIEAFTNLFEVTGEKSWLDLADQLTAACMEKFFDQEKQIFWFTSNGQTDLISRTAEVYDNVIPSSNSVMGKNLFKLGHLLERLDYLEIAENMAGKIVGRSADYPSGYSNWLQLLMDLHDEHFEIAIAGENAPGMLKEIQRFYLPNVIFCAGKSEQNLPLLKNRLVKGKTLIYICQNNTCQLPVENVESALSLIKTKR